MGLIGWETAQKHALKIHTIFRIWTAGKIRDTDSMCSGVKTDISLPAPNDIGDKGAGYVTAYIGLDLPGGLGPNHIKNENTLGSTAIEAGVSISSEKNPYTNWRWKANCRNNDQIILLQGLVDKGIIPNPIKLNNPEQQMVIKQKPLNFSASEQLNLNMDLHIVGHAWVPIFSERILKPYCWVLFRVTNLGTGEKTSLALLLKNHSYQNLNSYRAKFTTEIYHGNDYKPIKFTQPIRWSNMKIGTRSDVLNPFKPGYGYTWYPMKKETFMAYPDYVADYPLTSLEQQLKFKLYTNPEDDFAKQFGIKKRRFEILGDGDHYDFILPAPTYL